MIFDDSTNTLFVGGVGDPGRIWAVNPDDLSIRASIPDAGKWVTGLLRDPRDNRLFAANGDGEVLVIDARTYEILQRWKPAGAEKALLLNLALDPEGERLFVTDHSQLKSVLVLDARTGELRQRLPVGESMDINFQPARNALFVTHRDRGLVSELDASTYQLRQQYALPPQPNSLALSPTGDTLFVTIKTPFAPDRSASGVGSIARIELK